MTSYDNAWRPNHVNATGGSTAIQVNGQRDTQRMNRLRLRPARRLRQRRSDCWLTPPWTN